MRPSKMVRAVESTALAAERDQLFCVVGDSCQCTERFGCCASHHDDYEAVDRIEDDVNERTAAEECSRTHHAKHGGVAIQEYCGDQGEQCSADTDEHTCPFPESLDEVREYGNGDEIVMRCRCRIYFFAAVPPDLKTEPGNEGDHEPDQNKRGDHPASAVPKQVVVNGHYQQYDGCQQVEDRQDRIQPAEGFAEKLTGVDILEYRFENEKNLLSFIRIEDFKVNTSQ